MFTVVGKTVVDDVGGRVKEALGGELEGFHGATSSCTMRYMYHMVQVVLDCVKCPRVSV